MNYPQKDIDRFWSKVHVQYKNDETPDFNDCMEWTAGQFHEKNGNNYGRFYFNKQTLRAHRFNYECFYGTIPSGFVVCHLCDNTLCVNPYHLFIGTNQDNSNDMVNKGRSLRGSKNHNCLIDDSDAIKILKGIETGKYLTIDQIFKEYNITIRILRNILNNKRLNINCPENLRLKILNCSRPGSRNGNAKLNEIIVKEIKNQLQYYTNIELGKMFGVSRSAISDIRSGKRWKHVI